MQLPFIFADYIKGKTIYPSIRRSLSLLFSISITSCIFEKFYFKYAIPDITDYKALIHFFVNGQYIVPFSIFVVVHAITYFIPMIFFAYITNRNSVKLTKQVIEFELAENTIEREIGYVRALSKKVISLEINKDMLLNIYSEIQKEISEEKLQIIQKNCAEQRSIIETNFIFCFRLLVTVSIYFSMIPYFGIILLALVVTTILMCMTFLILANSFCDILPTFIRKFRIEADHYFEKYIISKTRQKIQAAEP